MLLRAGLKVVVYCGKTRLDFQTRDDTIDDGLVRKPVQRVLCKMGGTSTRTIDLGWVLDFGAIDWTELGMALREFISNAIDRTLREENGQFTPAMLDGRLTAATVTDEKVKARDGYTRVYVEVNGRCSSTSTSCRSVSALLDQPLAGQAGVPAQGQPELERQEDGRDLPRGGLRPRGRGLHDASIYDYNFRAGELAIDESRNSSDYAIRAAIAKLYRKATVPELVPSSGPSSICSRSSSPTWTRTTSAHRGISRRRSRPGLADGVAGRGADAVMCSPAGALAELVQRKGFP